MIKDVYFNSLSGYAKSRSSNATDADVDLAVKLHNLLPHGSGINGDWAICIGSKQVVQAYNTFDAMDEMGGYCHYYPFVVAVKIAGDKFELIGVRVFGRKHKCCGLGLEDYLNDDIAQCLKM